MDQPVDNVELKQQLMTDADAAFDSGDFTKALDFYHRAALLDNSDSGAWAALGLTFNNLDFPREAWRSFLLALNIDPQNASALWYAAEFLFEIEDLPLADIFLGHYLNVETEAERIEEARQLRGEVRAEGKARGLDFGDARSAEADQMLTIPEVEEAGAALDEDEASAALETAAWQLSEDELEQHALQGGRFLPPLTLKLSGFEGICQHCNLQIPYDAPYCWSCKMIHFYE